MAKITIKRTRASKSLVLQPITATGSEKKTVRITEADNGFTVCMYGPKGETSFVAKSESEALRHARMLLGSKK